MTESLSEKRMAQNEVAFRDANKRVQKGFEELKTIAEEEGVIFYVDPHMTLKFLCECADENCTKRIEVTLSEYNTIHQSSKHFIVSDTHNVPKIEDVIYRGEGYMVVEKHHNPPKKSTGLKKTPINNKKK